VNGIILIVKEKSAETMILKMDEGFHFRQNYLIQPLDLSKSGMIHRSVTSDNTALEGEKLHRRFKKASFEGV